MKTIRTCSPNIEAATKLRKTGPDRNPACERAADRTHHCAGKPCPPNVKSIHHVAFLRTYVCRVLLSCGLQFWNHAGVSQHHFFRVYVRGLQSQSSDAQQGGSLFFRNRLLPHVNCCLHAITRILSAACRKGCCELQLSQCWTLVLNRLQRIPPVKPDHCSLTTPRNLNKSALLRHRSKRRHGVQAHACTICLLPCCTTAHLDKKLIYLSLETILLSFTSTLQRPSLTLPVVPCAMS